MKTPFTVTVFGAESTGKTTLSQHLATALGTTWKHEFARNYLEQTGNDVTNNSMLDIWVGQRQLQQECTENEVVIQDTDLFSTVGYWQLPHIEPVIGKCPPQLIEDAKQLRSDLYIITTSTIPFEHDPLRFGGDHRESNDDYWIDICERYELPYIVLNERNPKLRINQSIQSIKERSKLPCVA